jgi:RNA polymerase-binding transcription factor DksA
MPTLTAHRPALLRERLPSLRTDLEALRASLRQEIADGERALATPATENDGSIAHGAGTYGICVDCGRPIPLDRLAARPQAARDVQCERTVERESAR